MKYRIFRTSDPNDTERPCEGSYPEGLQWYIWVEDLAELNMLTSEDASIIIHPENEIEIYDDFREKKDEI